MEEVMNYDLSVELALDLHAPNFDIARYEAALSVFSIRRLVLDGGSAYGHPDCDDSYLPKLLIMLIDCGIDRSNHTGMFLSAWKQLRGYMPSCEIAWQTGQRSFQQDLKRANSNPDDLGYLSQIEFAADCAYLNARNLYAHRSMSCQWFVNGYMRVWRGYFLKEEESGSRI